MLQRLLIAALGVLSVWLVVFVIFRIADNRLPWVLAIGATYAVTGAVIGEWTASSRMGLGTFLLSANAQMNTSGVYAAMVLMTLIGVGSFVILLVIEYLATPWRHRP